MCLEDHNRRILEPLSSCHMIVITLLETYVIFIDFCNWKIVYPVITLSNGVKYLTLMIAIILNNMYKMIYDCL
jgi:hypothetical protein